MSEPEQAKDGPTEAREPKVIKRYTNRKLYDTVDSRYVTLDEIAVMIKQGVEVQIVDNRSKEDLTSVTLAQIVFEEEKKKNQMPLAVLREIIRSPKESLSGFLQKEVGPRVASLKEEAEQRLDKLQGSQAAELLRSSQRTIEDWQRKIDDRVKLVVENVLGNLPALGRDLHELLARLEALEQKLEALERKKE